MKKIYLLATLILPIVSCNTTPVTYSYNDVKHLELSRDTLFSPTNSHYFVYVYSGGCYVCSALKKHIIPYSLSVDDFYYCLFEKEFNKGGNFDQNDILGVSDPNEVFLIGTPTMLEIINKKIFAYYLGADAILDALNLDVTL